MMMEFPQIQRLRQEQTDKLCEYLSGANPGTHDSVLRALNEYFYHNPTPKDKMQVNLLTGEVQTTDDVDAISDYVST